jgi:hypothetical protein
MGSLPYILGKIFKKVKKIILQQLHFPYMFPGIATVLSNALEEIIYEFDHQKEEIIT